jgi:hypothetical protein
MEGQQLLSQSEILQHKILARADGTENPSEKLTKRREHGSMLSQERAIMPHCKSLILNVHRVLMIDTREEGNVRKADRAHTEYPAFDGG